MFSVKKSNRDVSVQSDSDSDASVEDIPPDSDDGSSSTMSSSSGSSKPQRGVTTSFAFQQPITLWSSSLRGHTCNIKFQYLIFVSIIFFNMLYFEGTSCY